MTGVWRIWRIKGNFPNFISLLASMSCMKQLELYNSLCTPIKTVIHLLDYFIEFVDDLNHCVKLIDSLNALFWS